MCFFFFVLGLFVNLYELWLKESWIWKEFESVCNIRFFFYSFLGLYGIMLYMGIFYYIFCGKELWILKNGKFDVEYLKFVKECKVIEYFKFDGEVIFDLLFFVVFSGINYEGD